MNKTALVAAVTVKTGLTAKDSERVISAITDAITEALAGGDNVRLLGFGTFEVRERAARMGRNPKTREQISIAPSKSPIFKASSLLKNRIQ